jgi:hypothetical protein
MKTSRATVMYNDIRLIAVDICLCDRKILGAETKQGIFRVASRLRQMLSHGTVLHFLCSVFHADQSHSFSFFT